MAKKRFFLFITIILFIIIVYSSNINTYRIEFKLTDNKQIHTKYNQFNYQSDIEPLKDNSTLIPAITKNNVINEILNETSKKNYEEALDIFNKKTFKYNIAMDETLNSISDDLTLIINLIKNPETPLPIEPEIYSVDTLQAVGRKYHVKDKLPITYKNLNSLKNPEICSLVSLYASYELLAFLVDDMDSYVNLASPGEQIELIDTNPILSEKEKEFCNNIIKNKEGISDIYVYQLKNIDRELSFKCYLYKLYESPYVYIYGYYFDDLKPSASVDISTAKQFIEIYSAFAEKRKINDY